MQGTTPHTAHPSLSGAVAYRVYQARDIRAHAVVSRDPGRLSIYLMEPGTGFHPHPCRLAEVPVPSLVSLPTCRGTRPLACLSPHLPRYPSPRLSLSPTCRCACPRPTTYLSPRLSPPSTCRHACSPPPPPPHAQVHMHMYTSSKRSYVGLLLATHVPTCPQCSASQ